MISFFIPSLKDCMARLAKPLEAGRYSAVLMYRMPLDFSEFSNSILVKLVPLCIARITERTNVANVFLNFSIVMADQS